jgi:hypothetical protein
MACYRESIHEHHYQKMDSFLSFNDGVFQKPKSYMNENGYVCCNPYLLNYSKLLESYYVNFGEENVFTLFYEEFRDDKNSFLNEFATILNIYGLTIIQQNTIRNRGYSSGSINLLLRVMRCLKSIGLSFLVPKPIHFWGKESVYVKDYDNIYAQKANYFLNSEPLSKFTLYFVFKIHRRVFNRGRVWRNIFKLISGKIKLGNSKLISDEVLDELNTHYLNENRNLKKLLSGRPLPENYLLIFVLEA